MLVLCPPTVPKEWWRKVFQSFDLPMERVDYSEYLSILSYAPAEDVIAFVDQISSLIGPVEVLNVRTGLLALPTPDDAGLPAEACEVLITEAFVHTLGGADGYGMCIGRDQEHAAAIATLDAALHADTTGLLRSRIMAFVDEQARRLASA
jgi:alpha-D-ribose 1-methylphosphonate 5-triphosphate synthase subunit PhnG